MKKKLFALSGVFLIALVIAGLWATKAVNFIDTANTRERIRYPFGDVNGANDAEASAIVMAKPSPPKVSGSGVAWLHR